MNSFQRKTEMTLVHIQKHVPLIIEAKCLVGYGQSKGQNTTTTHEKLVHRFHEKVSPCSLVVNWIRRLHLNQDIFEPETYTGQPSASLIDFLILTKTTIFPFLGMRTLAGIVKIPPPRSVIIYKRDSLL
jgi:hypothetical protein